MNYELMAVPLTAQVLSSMQRIKDGRDNPSFKPGSFNELTKEVSPICRLLQTSLLTGGDLPHYDQTRNELKEVTPKLNIKRKEEFHGFLSDLKERIIEVPQKSRLKPEGLFADMYEKLSTDLLDRRSARRLLKADIPFEFELAIAICIFGMLRVTSGHLPGSDVSLAMKLTILAQSLQQPEKRMEMLRQIGLHSLAYQAINYAIDSDLLRELQKGSQAVVVPTRKGRIAVMDKKRRRR